MKLSHSTPFHTLKDSKKNLTLKKQHENVTPKSPYDQEQVIAFFQGAFVPGISPSSVPTCNSAHQADPHHPVSQSSDMHICSYYLPSPPSRHLCCPP